MTVLTSLLPIKTNLYVTRGSTFAHSFVVKDTSNVAVNLTGMSLEAFGKRYAGVSNTFEIVTNIGVAVTGVISLSLDDASTADLIFDRYIFNVMLSDGSSNVSIISGDILVDGI